MGYFYSEKVGLVEREDFGAETPDEAVLKYYLSEVEKFNATIDDYNAELKRCKANLLMLHSNYSYLKDKFPEEFI